MSQTRDQKHFTISEAAADWHEHELITPQRSTVFALPNNRIRGAVCKYTTI